MSHVPLPEAERLARLRLARTERVGAVAFEHLVKRFGSAESAIENLPDLVRRTGGSIRVAPLADAERELDAGRKLGARLIVCGEGAFPPLLAALDPPAPLIWTLGDPTLLLSETVAIVGARTASAAGQRFARGLANELGAAGFVIVSGLARGVDAAAHEGSLESGTVAVLGGGVDDVYPPENANLYERIAEKGCIVSESPVGARAQARDFPRRNRLISGLSLGVVVVEAEMRSGSLITARLAGEQGREVFAVPGSPLDPRARGTNDLIRQGATLCEGADDVLRSLAAPRGLREPSGGAWEAPSDREADALREKVRALLTDVAVPRDELVRATGASAGAIAAVLVELVLAGEAELLDGGLVCAA